jgi:hypothetical protein
LILVEMFPDVTGSRKSKMVAIKPDILIPSAIGCIDSNEIQTVSEARLFNCETAKIEWCNRKSECQDGGFITKST